MKLPTRIPNDDVLVKAFITSSFLGLASFAAPVVAPIALTGMALSQGLFWSRELTKNDENKDED